MNNISQRDAFWDRLYELAALNRDIILVSADMGAPSLDRFRRDLPGQFVNTGIAEQNAVLISAGLALAGKKVFAYAIAPFITLRCLEQIRVELSMMNLPVTIVGVGAGLGYEDSGPTHHLIEDIAVMRSLPNIVINSITDSAMAAAAADLSLTMKHPNYVRLERQVLPLLYGKTSDFSQGLTLLKQGKDGLVLATGCMTHTALEIVQRLEQQGLNLGVADIYRIPVNEEALLRTVATMPKLVTLEEHFLPGGMGSAVCEVLTDRGTTIPVKRLGLPVQKGYCYRYGGRENLRAYYGLDKGSIEKDIKAFFGKA